MPPMRFPIILSLALSLALSLTSGLASAQSPSSPSSSTASPSPSPSITQGKVYFGGGLGPAVADVEFTTLPDNRTFDDQSEGFFVYAGTMFGENLGLEVYYADLGEYTLNRRDQPASGENGTIFIVTSQAYGVAARFITDPTPSGAIAFVRLGVDFGSPGVREAPNCGTPCDREGIRVTSDGFLMAGLGVGFPLDRGHLTLGADLYTAAAASMFYLGYHSTIQPPSG